MSHGWDRAGLREILHSALLYSVLSTGCPPPLGSVGEEGQAFPASLLIPSSISISLWGSLLLHLSPFPSFVVLFPPAFAVPRSYGSCPFLHDLLVARLRGREGERGPWVYYI